jgi:hypothetical protein
LQDFLLRMSKHFSKLMGLIVCADEGKAHERLCCISKSLAQAEQQDQAVGPKVSRPDVGFACKEFISKKDERKERNDVIIKASRLSLLFNLVCKIFRGEHYIYRDFPQKTAT